MTASPTKLQVALAMSIVRMKPPELSIEQFIYDLRGHIDVGQRPQFSATYQESQNKYINAAFYFEALLKESEKKEQDLEKQLVESERENERLKAKLIAREHEAPPNNANRKKQDRQKTIAGAGAHAAPTEQRLLMQEEDNLRQEIEAATTDSRSKSPPETRPHAIADDC